MTFSEAYALYGPDVERIAAETGMARAEVDHLINVEMDEAYLKRRKIEQAKQHERNEAKWQRNKATLADLRKGRSA